jgi:tetratricopeptide (TPR) repeat protein
MNANKTRVLIIISALILFVLLFIAPKTPSKELAKENTAARSVTMDATLEMYLNMAIKNLDSSDTRRLKKLQENKGSDSLILFWDRLKRPDLASYFAENLAKTKNSAFDWSKAGDRYYYAIAFCKDKTEVPVLYQCAIRCYNKSLALDPKNTDAKIMLASCYVEGTQEPMEGINKLREVEKVDSNNVKLQLAFAFFSVKSQQFDKAIVRFNKVLQVDSNYIEAYLHLADAYEQKGETNKTIENLEKYASKTTDMTARLEIEKYIKQLKQSR